MLLILFNLKGLTESIPIIKNSEDPLLIKVQLKKDTNGVCINHHQENPSVEVTPAGESGWSI
jgi:hypothetical protein